MNLESFIGKENIIILKSSEKHEAIHELLDKLEHLKKIKDASKYYAQVLHRESIENTGIGNGVAIPHTRSENAPDFVCAFGVSNKGIDYHSFDGMPMRYMALSIIPMEQSTKYLYFIGMISWILTHDLYRIPLDAAKSSSRIHSILSKASLQYFNSISKKEPPSIVKEPVPLITPIELDFIIRLDHLYLLAEDSIHSDVISKKIMELKTLINPRILSYYEKMKAHGKNPFSILQKTSCSICHMGIPPIQLEEMKETNHVNYCPHCGRFLLEI
jgi:nitrogen PTS system EIIA component